jgi:hypothetical protein
MAFIHEGSCECAKSELDLFSVPATQTSIESGTYVEYHSISSLTGAAPIEFDVSASGDDYLDLANSFLCVRAKITRVNNDDLDAADTVGPVNNFLHSLFSQVDVSLNGTLTTNSTNTYAYRAYIETMLSYGLEAKSSQLTSALFYKDEAGKMDKSNPLAANAVDRNSGLAKRQTFGAESHEIDMIGRIHTDIFFQERYMLNEVNAKIKLIRSNDAFCLMATGGQQFKVVVTAASLLIRIIKLSTSVFLAHAKTLENGTAKYPIWRVICKSFTVPAGYLDVSHEKLFSGQLPVRLIVGLIVGLVDNRAYNGDRERNPFNFQHFSLTEIGIYLDGQLHGLKPLKLDFAANRYVAAYAGLFGGTNKINRDEGNDIDRSDYAGGYALYAYDLTPDLAENDHVNLSRQGTVRLNLKFGAALAHTITVVAYAEFENMIEIDRNRNIVFDFSN